MVLVGRIARPVGLRGEVVVEPYGDDPNRFSKGTRLLAQTQPHRELRIRGSRAYRGRYAVLFEGVESWEAAEELRDVALVVPEEDLPKLPTGVYYHYQVLGLTVVDVDGAVLGRIDSILETGSNDVYCVGEGPEQILIPAVRDYVGRIDLTSGRIFLNVPRRALGTEDDPVLGAP
jgi:16S rRNA processing protein RimM